MRLLSSHQIIQKQMASASALQSWLSFVRFVLLALHFQSVATSAWLETETENEGSKQSKIEKTETRHGSLPPNKLTDESTSSKDLLLMNLAISEGMLMISFESMRTNLLLLGRSLPS